MGLTGSLWRFPVHAAVIAINEAIDRQVPADTLMAMKNPNAMLINLDDQLESTYQDTLYRAKQDKMENAKNRVDQFFFQTLYLHACGFVLQRKLWGIHRNVSYSPVCVVLGGFTPARLPVCSLVSCLPVVEDRRRLAVLLRSCLKYRPHVQNPRQPLC